MEYKVGRDLELTRYLCGISQEEAAREIGIDRTTLLRIEKSEFTPSEKTINQIYSYLYKKGIDINEIKAMFYDEQMDVGTLLVHGSKSYIDGKIAPFKSRKTSDFGQAFYCAESVKQASLFVTEFEGSCIYILGFDDRNLNRVNFEINQEWMLAVAYFRGTLDKYKDHPKIQKIVNKVKNADYIVAPIADNRMFDIIGQFVDGYITDEQCEHCLDATHLGMQYAFLTEKATSKIKIFERCFVSTEERNANRKSRLRDSQLSENKVKEAMRLYRNKGKYIEELLDETAK